MGGEGRGAELRQFWRDKLLISQFRVGGQDGCVMSPGGDGFQMLLAGPLRGTPDARGHYHFSLCHRRKHLSGPR